MDKKNILNSSYNTYNMLKVLIMLNLKQTHELLQKVLQTSTLRHIVQKT